MQSLFGKIHSYLGTISISMGNSSTVHRILDEETLNNYVELTYLCKNEIRRIIKLLDNVDPGKLHENLQHRFTIKQIEKAFPQLSCNPFRDSIYRIFSSKKDEHFSLEDVLDLCSAFSENCPNDVRAAWAFSIFDFDGDNQISLDDLIEAVQRLTRYDRREYEGIDMAETENVARMVLKEMVYNQQGTISSEEFVHYVSRICEFSSTLYFRL